MNYEQADLHSIVQVYKRKYSFILEMSTRNSAQNIWDFEGFDQKRCMSGTYKEDF